MPGPTNKVWWRESDGWWYTTIRKSQKRLAKGRRSKTQAEAALKKLLEKPQATSFERETVARLLVLYLNHIEGGDPKEIKDRKSLVGPDRLRSIHVAVASFHKACGSILIGKLEPSHAREWIKANPNWAASTWTAHLATIRAAFNWAMREDVGLLERNPLKRFHGPGYTRREHIPTGRDIDLIMSYRNQRIVDFCQALVHTGSRPSEVSRVEAKDVDLKRRTWTMTRHKTMAKKPSPRVIWLDSFMLAMTKRLMKANPEGPIFRNSYGTRWKAGTVVRIFKQMRKKFDIHQDVTAYTFRHEYITRALASGVDVVTVSAMCGTSVKMIVKHYAHLMQRPDHMLASVEKVRRGRKA